jgi:hypothetical protein
MLVADADDATKRYGLGEAVRAGDHANDFSATL